MSKLWWAKRPKTPWYEAAPGRFLLRVEGSAKYYVENGALIVIEPYPAAQPEAIRGYLAKGSLLRFIKIILSNTVMTFFGPFSYFDNSRQGQPRLVRREFARKMKRRCKRDILYFTVDPVKHLESGNIQTRTELAAWVDAEYNVQHLFPYLDYRVVDFAMSVPRRLYYKEGMNRYLFRKAFESLLPEKLCYYTYKDDIARCTYFGETTKQRWETTRDTGKRLDRERFAPYIDWDRLEKLLDSPDCREDLRSNHLLSKKIRVCDLLQRMVAEAEE